MRWRWWKIDCINGSPYNTQIRYHNSFQLQYIRSTTDQYPVPRQSLCIIPKSTQTYQDTFDCLPVLCTNQDQLQPKIVQWLLLEIMVPIHMACCPQEMFGQCENSKWYQRVLKITAVVFVTCLLMGVTYNTHVNGSSKSRLSTRFVSDEDQCN